MKSIIIITILALITSLYFKLEYKNREINEKICNNLGGVARFEVIPMHCAIPNKETLEIKKIHYRDLHYYK